MKRQLFVGLASLVMAAPAFADESTVIAMANLGPYMNDDTNQFLFPTTMMNYKNHVFVELKDQETGDQHQSAGATVWFPKLEGNVGVYLNRAILGGFQDDYTDAIQTDRVHSIMFQRGNWALGVGMGGDHFEFEPGEDPTAGTLTEETVSYWDVNGGLAGNWFGNVQSELGARVAILSGERIFEGSADEGGPDSEESGFQFGVGLRNWYDRGQNGKLVSLLNFQMQSGNVDPEEATGDPASETDTNVMAFGGGLGWHYPVTRNVMVIMVAEPWGYARTKVENKIGDDTNTTTTTAMPYFSHYFAMQADVSRRVVARIGVAQTNVITKVKEETETTDPDEENETKNRDSLFEISMGLGVNLGDSWWINGVFNEQTLYTGPYLLSGATAGSAVSRVSIIGNFD